ncbi:MAG: fused response regulator/phosphatase [Rhodocyclaceae bacterium]|nr:fused response regulator/phosphatase [Rhodocyclaceae bacterium]
MQPCSEIIAGMKVLIVDDTTTNLHILRAFLGKLGCKVFLAENGALGVAAFIREAPDLVLMDVMMPVMDGYEATRQIKMLSPDRWVPVIFLSALDKDESLVTGLEAGGDDYLSKPVNFVVLQAKICSFARTVKMQSVVRDYMVSLQKYHDEREAENVLANGIMDRLAQRGQSEDAHVYRWMMPASAFSGDIIANARSPDGKLYAMLADATGHGLAAAVSVVPVLTTFYSLVEHGYPLGYVAYELNRQLMTFLPTGRFVAASIVCIDTDTHSCALWTGGMPTPLLLGADGSLIHTFASTRLPLGIIEFDEELAGIEKFDCPADSQLVLFSDGLTEAGNDSSSCIAFGEDRLLHALSATSKKEDRLNAVLAAFDAHVGSCVPHDDISLLLLNC